MGSSAGVPSPAVLQLLSAGSISEEQGGGRMEGSVEEEQLSARAPTPYQRMQVPACHHGAPGTTGHNPYLLPGSSRGNAPPAQQGGKAGCGCSASVSVSSGAGWKQGRKGEWCWQTNAEQIQTLPEATGGGRKKTTVWVPRSTIEQGGCCCLCPPQHCHHGYRQLLRGIPGTLCDPMESTLESWAHVLCWSWAPTSPPGR